MNEYQKFLEVFKIEKPIIGMIHLFGNTDEEIIEIAKMEVDTLIDNGIDAVIVENYACRDITILSLVLDYIATNRSNIIYGVNTLGNYELAFELAKAYNAKFIQIDSVAGHLPPIHDAVYHNKLNYLRSTCNAILLGGVRFKYQPVLSERTVTDDLQIGMQRCDAIVVAGEGTGIETGLQKIKEFRRVIECFPLIVGAGLTSNNCFDQLMIADGGIVGSYLKEGHIDRGIVSPTYTSEFTGIVKSLRK